MPCNSRSAAAEWLERAYATKIVFKPGQFVRVNLAGMQVQGVLFHAAVTDAVGNIVKRTSEDPPKYQIGRASCRERV